MSKTHAFTDRVLKELNNRIVVWPDNRSIVLAVVDQLLVEVDVVKDVIAFLNGEGVETKQLGTVFAGLPAKPSDTAIIELLNLPSGQQIFDVTDDVRARVEVVQANPRKVSPNHILVPAPNDVGCPADAPREAPNVSLAYPPPGPSPSVTVIDSGYQWDKTWGANPLRELCHARVRYAEWLLGSQIASLATSVTASTGWHRGEPEKPVANNSLMGVMAGHANFVAGVIAQGCDMPTINIWSHNGAFVENTDFFPTEAAVCRSILMSQQQPPKGTGPTDIIHVGFAFPLRLPKTDLKLAKDFLSTVWDTTLQTIGPESLVVAPAGNEKEENPHYPAALDYAFPKSHFTSVKGVGSLDPTTYKLSAFSNRGPWVSCSTIGEQVVSTFLRVKNVQCEDDPTPRPRKTFAPQAWALWDGTSFAAPKVTAALAARVAAGASTDAAWRALHAVHANPLTYPGAGARFTNL
jgi:hypothetical protein